MKPSYLFNFIVISLLLSILILSFYIYRIVKYQDTKINTSTKEVKELKDNDIQPLQKDEASIYDYVTLRGIIKKEPIPPELELGDYWYWFYFDEPYLLKNNARGIPLYIEKIEVFPAERQHKGIYDIDEFLDAKVEIYGYQTWGYAESSVIQILSIAQL